MRIKKVLFMLLLVSLFINGQDGDERGLFRVRRSEAAVQYGEYHLLAIGINNYIHWPSLKTAVNDTRALVKALSEGYGFAPERIKELYNADATEENIIAALRDLARTVRKEDSLLIYYAGHGHIDNLTRAGFWIPVDGARNNPATWIDNTMIKRYLNVNAIKARHILMISDSCFSGDFFADQRGAVPEITDAYVKKAFQKTSRQAITSGGIEPVMDAGFGGHSVFSYFLLKALQENTEPFLLPTALHERIKGGVSANAQQQTQLGILSGTGGELGGAFVFFREGASEELERMLERKQERLTLLSKAEEEMKAKDDAARVEIEKKEKELAAIEKKISDMQKKLGSSAFGKENDLDAFLAIVQKKEVQEEDIARLKEEREEAKKKREEDLAKLKKEEGRERFFAVFKDIEKYNEVASSKYGKSIRKSMWKTLQEKWNIGGHFQWDIESFLIDTHVLTTPEKSETIKNAEAAKGAGKDSVKLWMRAGLIRIRQWKWSDAISWFEKIRKADPDHAWAEYAIGYIKYKEKKYDEAESHLKKVIEMDGSIALFRRYLSEVYLKRKEYDKALAEINKAIEMEPEVYLGWTTRGRIFKEKKDYKSVLRDFKKAAEIKKNNTWVLGWIKWVYERLKEYDNALEVAEKMLKIRPDYSDYLSSKASILNRLKRSDEALKIYNDLVAKYPENTSYLSSKAFTLRYKLRRYEEALETYDRLLKLAPGNVTYLSAKADILRWSLKRYDEAIKVYDKLIAGDPSKSTYYGYKASIYINSLKTPDKGISVCRDYLSKNSDSARMFYYWGSALIDNKEYHQAIEKMNKALEVDPKYTSAILALPHLLSCIGNVSESTLAYKKCALLLPKDASFWTDYAAALERESRFNEAVEVYEKAGKLNLNHKDAYIAKIGTIWLYKGDINKAEEIFRDMQKYPERVQFFSRGLGICEALKSNPKEALTHFYKAIETAKHARRYSYIFPALMEMVLGNKEKLEKVVQELVKGKIIDINLYNVYHVAYMMVFLGKYDEMAELVVRFSQTDTERSKWQNELLKYFLGEHDQRSLLEKASSLPNTDYGHFFTTEKDRLCEAYYYTGMMDLASGQWESGKQKLEKCVETKAHRFREYMYAKVILANFSILRWNWFANMND